MIRDEKRKKSEFGKIRTGTHLILSYATSQGITLLPTVRQMLNNAVHRDEMNMTRLYSQPFSRNLMSLFSTFYLDFCSKFNDFNVEMVLFVLLLLGLNPLP